MIGKLQRVPLREVWQHEALDFTTWLEDNYDVLNEVLDINLSSVEREQAAGSFNVDLVAEDEGGDLVIIENQLAKTDHDHLGKLITYLTALEAKTALWIASDPRPEHVRAISWLNESSPAAFYLLKVEAVKIGDSPPAPLLTLIVGPSEESREVGETKKDLAERYIIRRRFWTQLLHRAKPKTTLHANISPSRENWISTGAGRTGLGYNYAIRQHDAQVELYIDRGKDSADENKSIFDALAQSKGAVEETFGQPLEWQRLDAKRASRIRYRVDLGGYRDESRWQEVHEAMIDAMIRLEAALHPYVAKLRL